MFNCHSTRNDSFQEKEEAITISLRMQAEMAQNELRSMDLNVRIIQAVEYYPLLYKGRATIEERQAVWQQLSQQLQVAESVLKSRWHILCGYYQRYLEKRRSTDEEGNGDDGNSDNSFRYEKEMAFMMPYMHARIAIAAANAARKQQELAAAGNKELTDPEFIITEKDLENASRMNNNLGDEYVFYDVETLDGEVEGQGHQYPHQNHQEHEHQIIDESSQIDCDTESGEMQDQNLQHEEIGEEVIEEVDESGNIVVQDLIIEGGELVGEDGEQIVVEEEEVLAMDDQIETVVEEVVENTPSLVEMHPHVPAPTSLPTLPPAPRNMVTHTLFIQGNGTRQIVRVPSTNGHKFVKIVQGTTKSCAPSQQEAQQLQKSQMQYHYVKQKESEEFLPEQQQEREMLQSIPSFAQEYSIMTRRRRAIVLKATPRIQVELTDNAAVNAPTNSVEIREEIGGASLDVAANAEVIGNNCEKEVTQGAANVDGKGNSSTSDQQQHINERLHESCSDYDNRSNDSNAVTTTAIENEDEHTTKGERSEDTIFGELVTAMLKHMPQERKRAIKRSIMDLLLT